jgi:lipopolysaccharide assembly outer membrane protein LptD (OstA)
MKLLALGIAIACHICAFGSMAMCQESTTQTARLHLSRAFPEGLGSRVEFTASSAQRDLSSKKSEFILQLRGNVEARTITCVRSGVGDRVICEGSMVLHADSVDFNETTGEMDARGNVRMIPYRAVTVIAK